MSCSHTSQIPATQIDPPSTSVYASVEILFVLQFLRCENLQAQSPAVVEFLWNNTTASPEFLADFETL